MSLPQHILYGQGGTLHLDVLDRPANALVTAYDGDGTAVFRSRTCTLSNINTTVNGAVNKGATLINVASNTGFAVGGRFWLQDDPEEALCQKVAGGSITLRRPLTRDHIAGALVEGTRISYQANSSDANATWWDGHLDWNIDGTIQHQSAVECTKYLMTRVATAQDLYDEDPVFFSTFDPKMDIERMLDLAHQDVLTRIAAKSPEARGRVMPASESFVQATVFAFYERLYRPRAGMEQQALADGYAKRLNEEIERIAGILPRDADQDGAVETHEKLSVRSIRLRR